MLSPYRVEDAAPYLMTTAIVPSPLPTPGEIKRGGSPIPPPLHPGVGYPVRTPGGGFWNGTPRKFNALYSIHERTRERDPRGV